MKNWKHSFMAVLSGLLVGVALMHLIWVLALVAYIPLFLSLRDKKLKPALKIALLFGASLSFVAFFWMIPAASQFTSGIVYGILAFFVAIVVLTIFLAAFVFTIWYLNGKLKTKSLLLQSAFVAALWVVIEFIWQAIVAGMPWFFYQTGSVFASSLWAIQPVSVFGVHIASFAIIFTNYLAAGYVNMHKWVKALISYLIIVAYFIFGFFLLRNFEIEYSTSKKKVDVAILAGNISSEMKWDSHTGNMLVKRMFDLNKDTKKLNPDIVLWSESAVPWTFRADDDFLLEITRSMGKEKTCHIFGINTQGEGYQLFNSAYCISSGGDVTGRYDKQSLLSLIEKPLAGILLPFYACKECFYTPSNYSKPLETPYGKAGIMICNETVLSKTVQNAVSNGAEFLLNMGNDAWFSDSYIARLHFYTTRLRAAESRKDVVVNSNMGISGFISASGRIISEEKNKEPFTKVFQVNSNQIAPFAIKHPTFFIYILCIIALSILLVSKFKNI